MEGKKQNLRWYCAGDGYSMGMCEVNKWAHIFNRLAHIIPGFGECHNMFSGPRGIVFRTAVPCSGGYFFRCMFAVAPDGRIFGPRSREVDEVILLAWMNDPKGLNDFC